MKRKRIEVIKNNLYFLLTKKIYHVTILPSKGGRTGGVLNNIQDNIRSQNLLRIKRIADIDKDGDSFIIIRTQKNKNFMREYNLIDEDVKDIIRSLSVSDCFSGPEKDRDIRFKGEIFKFSPMYNDMKLYIKIRIENINKSVCLSIHEFGLYDEVK